jgi:hypothetical protein
VTAIVYVYAHLIEDDHDAMAALGAMGQLQALNVPR